METRTLVDRRALLSRINRRLQKQGRKMFRTRGTAGWFIVSLKEGSVVRSQDDLIACAVRVGALAKEETLAQ